LAAASLLLLATAPASDCRLTTGPNGLCAGLQLDPSSAEMRSGTTLTIRINDFEASCFDSGGRRRWESSAPEVATVDSNGLVRAGSAGAAVIRLMVERENAPAAATRITVTP
jgi:uncharacterized protein YjdB